jgi:hypothetical protein
MTREQYIRTLNRIPLYKGLSACLGASAFNCVFMSLLVWMGHSLEIPAKQFPNEGVRGLVGGLSASVVIFPLFLLSTLTPFYWADRMLGLRCPACGKSVTHFVQHKVLESGKCRNCQAPLFSPHQPDS